MVKLVEVGAGWPCAMATPSQNPPRAWKSLDAVGMGYTVAWVEGRDRRGTGWLWQVLTTGVLCFLWFQRFFISPLSKEDFFLPCLEREMQKCVASLEETSAQMGFGEELVFLLVLWCSRPALHPLTV